MNRLVVAGDTHGDIEQVTYLLGVAMGGHAEAVFIVGDYGFWEHQHDGIVFNDEVDQLSGYTGIPVYFLDGNHDKTSLILSKYHDRDDEGFIIVRPNVRYAPRGHRWTWGNTRFIALGGAYSVDKAWRLANEARRQEKFDRRNWYRVKAGRPPRQKTHAGTLWFPEEEMSDEDMAAILAADPSPVDVILAHDKPRSSALPWNRKNLPECWPNQDRLQMAMLTLRPRRFIHGHLHYRYDFHSRISGDEWCHVVGLDCNPEGACTPGYKRSDSWLILDL